MLRFALIGETSLLIVCTKHILKSKIHNTQIAICTKNPEVISWCQANDIYFATSLKNFQKYLTRFKPDYLYSIVNYTYIPASLRRLVKHLSINYHDSLLPNYAGVNATSWAILNDEKKHGVTWHVMTDKLDAGEILEQEKVNIDEKETALTLNVKCFNAALTTFKSLFSKILENKLVVPNQTSNDLTYFTYSMQLPRLGLIDWHDTAKNISRMVRSCTLGNYPNRFGVVKCLIADQIYYVEQIEEVKAQNTSPIPGRVIVLSSGEWAIETTTSALKFIRLLDVERRLVNFQNLCEKAPLNPGDCLSSISRAECIPCEEYISTIASHETYWLKQFSNAEPLKIPSALLDPNAIKCELTTSLSSLGIRDQEELLALVYIYLYRINNQKSNTLFIGLENETQLNKIAAKLCGHYSPLSLTLTGEEYFKDVMSAIYRVKETHKKNKNFIQDIFIRYPEFENLQIDSRLFPPVIFHGSGNEKIHWNKTTELAIVMSQDKKECTFISKVSQSELAQIIKRLQHIAAQVKKSKNILSFKKPKNIANLPLLLESEYQKIIFDWNNTAALYPKDKSIHKLFEEQVVKTPNSIAVIHDNKELTYDKLNEQINQLSHYLKKKYKIKPDDPIILCLNRNEQMLIAILAVLKAGGAYVPIDPNYPDARIRYILEDAKAELILSSQAYIKQLESIKPIQTMSIVALDNKKFIQEIKRQKKENPVNTVKSNHLAYILYTSGTTGNPKGVMIEQQNVISFASNFTNYPLSKNDGLTMLSTTNYVFDIFALEYLLPLLNGYHLELADLTNIKAKIDLYKYNCIQITPSKLELLIEQINYEVQIPEKHVVTLLIGGEAINKNTLKRIHKLKENLLNHKQNIDFKVINVYGPTETTIWSAAAHLDYHSDNPEIIIGKPLCNEALYILDVNEQPLIPGAIGELYIGGAGLARGYLHQAQLTAEKFIPNPFQTKNEKKEAKNTRIYKTGDLARWHADGNVEFIGRTDFQVKIRGYRIELTEIENILEKYPTLRHVVVIAKDYKNRNDQSADTKYLVAYYISDQKLDESRLQDYLSKYLPDYMIPGMFIHMHKFPLTANGKLDRQALPNPVFAHNPYVHPRNAQEQLICQAFAKALGLDQVGIYDDFFQIGGNSIKAISLASALQTNFDINVADIFNLRTPKQLGQGAYFGKDMLKRKLEQVKTLYQNKKSKDSKLNEWLEKKSDLYLAKIKNLHIDCHQQKPITNVLLTGVTGYLGCNLLNQLLSLTNYKIFLLVRANSSEEAFERVNKKFQFYFNQKLDAFRDVRIFTFAADIEQEKLGLSIVNYQMLVSKIDTIIHPAALTKHYGEYDRFYSANVQATINLLEFCKLTHLKDFHYISTISVLNEGFIPGYDNYVFTEDDLPDSLEGRSNVYVKTKYEGEKVVINYRAYGINANIYRVGNLAFISTNSQTQENIQDNAFLNRLECMLNLGILAQEVSTEEISLVDLTAQAIVKLFNKKKLINQIYHIFNPNICNLSQVLSRTKNTRVKTVTIEEFIDTIIASLDNPQHRKSIERFLLHQGWLNQWQTHSTAIQIFQEKTQHLLKQLNFEWPPITEKIFNNYLKQRKENEKESKNT